jgi:hypothetical protein
MSVPHCVRAYVARVRYRLVRTARQLAISSTRQLNLASKLGQNSAYMLYWECERRLDLLRQFRALVFDYFQNIEYPGWASAGTPPRMNDISQKARNQINYLLEDAERSFDILGISRVMVYTPPPRVGGYAQRVNLIANMFSLWQLQIGPEYVLDLTDKAIGTYERECQRLLRKSFNPFYWAALPIAWLLRLPFKLIGAVGFDATKAEQSRVGKLVKLVVAVAAFVVSIVTIADHWGMVWGFVHKCAVALHHL